jgi:hypothetical protein
MFSPIPFLVRPAPDEGEMDVDIPGDSEAESSLRIHTRKEELMSPLLLDERPLEVEAGEGGGAASSSSSADQDHTDASTDTRANARSQTPEPEDTASRIPPRPAPPPVVEPLLTGSESSDPGHQPYLGRVDELDTGPIVSRPSSDTPVPGAKKEDRGDQGEGMGTGEGGNMTPHGMSERPVPISATTVVEESERKVAGLPRSKSVLGLAERSEEVEVDSEEKVKAEDGEEREKEAGAIVDSSQLE